MSIKASTYVALIGCAFIAIAALFSVTIYAGRAWTHSAERHEAELNMHEVRRAIDVDLEALDVSAHDWAAWDEVYWYMEDRNERFHQASLADPSYLELGLNSDALILVNLEREVVDELLSTSFSPDADAVDELHRLVLEPGGLADQAIADADGMSGVLRSGDTVMLFSARQIMRSDETGPPHGALVLARTLDPQVLARIGSVPNVKLTLHPDDDPSMHPEVRASLDAGPADATPVVHIDRPLDITAYLPLFDWNGEPVGYLSSVRPAYGYDTSMRILTSLIAVFLLGGLGWAAAAFEIINRSSIARIVQLRDQVAQIGQRGDLSARIELGATRRSDETGTVAESINDMLAALEESRHREVSTETQHRVLVENMSDAVFTMSPDRTFTFVNDRAVALMGMGRETLRAIDYARLIKSSSLAAVETSLAAIDSGGPVRMLDIEMIRGDGLCFPVELSVSPVRDPGGSLVAIHWIVRDVTERRHFEDQLVHLASHDHLTGLLNRRRFEEVAGRSLTAARADGAEAGLLWIDIDRFKHFNDTHGHRIGDVVLVGFANILVSQIREGDVICRLGGDEFALLMPNCGRQESLQAAERILAELTRSMIPVGTMSLQVTASIGAAVFPADATDVQGLLMCADVAMYEAKKGGRNRVSLYSAEDDWPQSVDVHRTWGTLIEMALAEDDVVAFAQPIMELASGRIGAFELLVRIKNADGSISGPAEFLPAAEHLGLVTQIDRYMVRRAADLLTSPLLPSDTAVHVNLSGKTISDAGFPGFVHATLVETGADSRRLVFELTETALVTNMSRAREFIETLRDLGCGFALDDFGSGFSSLTYLRHMPVDRLKIDGSLIRGTPLSDQDRNLVKTIVDLARCLSIPVTAEYVESEEVLELVRAMDVDTVQGDYIGCAEDAETAIRSAFPNSDAVGESCG